MSGKNHQYNRLCNLPLQDLEIEFTRSTYSRTADLADGETIRLCPFIDFLVHGM